jgi:hypothetical protein
MTFSMTPSVKRILGLQPLLKKKSHFLFGPRQTGKTYLLHQDLGDVPTYDMLGSSVFVALSQSPRRIGEEVQGRSRVVVIDEIQRLPDLLHEVHRLIESRGFHFLLTGSSPRKLRREGVNLLGGQEHSTCIRSAGKSSGWNTIFREPLGMVCSRRFISPTNRRQISGPTPARTSSRKLGRKAPPEMYRHSVDSCRSRLMPTAQS